VEGFAKVCSSKGNDDKQKSASDRPGNNINENKVNQKRQTLKNCLVGVVATKCQLSRLQ
jgi:hypothetical protein